MSLRKKPPKTSGQVSFAHAVAMSFYNTSCCGQGLINDLNLLMCISVALGQLKGKLYQYGLEVYCRLEQLFQVKSTQIR